MAIIKSLVFGIFSIDKNALGEVMEGLIVVSLTFILSFVSLKLILFIIMVAYWMSL